MGDIDSTSFKGLTPVYRRGSFDQLHRWERRFIGYAVDGGLHLAFALVVWLGFAIALPDADLWWRFEVAVAGYALVSYAHRVLFQRRTGTTIGKALVGMSVVSEDTGARPSLLDLNLQWFIGATAVGAYMAYRLHELI
ncbi:RDD family protein [Kutzneria sp. NPDC051319]|uniref:RDD family protein n=1 Tax=Kutzneria sp. NPDC051319 TaxID=3155047 RepID=UPI00344A8B1D